MSGVDQLQYLSWLLYLVIFALVLVRAVRRPTPAHIDIALFFGAISIIVVEGVAVRLDLPLPTWISVNLAPAAALALGYLLLRLVNDFSHVPPFLIRAVEIGMLLSIVAVVLAGPELPPSVVAGVVVYLGVVLGYDAVAFARHASNSRGVTRRRMQAAAVASVCVALVLVVAALSLVVPTLAWVWDELAALLSVASAIGYFIGFAPPTWLRRTWQDPEVRAFLTRAVHLAGLADRLEIVHELELGAADAFGAPVARIALWDADKRCLRVDDSLLPPALSSAFDEQRPTLLQIDLNGPDASQSASLGVANAQAALAAPITAYDKRLGELVVFAPRSPIFANSDLELIQLLADQAAVILESKELIDQSSKVRAREDAARLKEDFLSSAAHDLKTPLTGIVTQAQVLQRRADRNPSGPIDRVGLDRLLQQSHRLKRLVLELLDVSRLEQGSLIGEREAIDLVEMVCALVEAERSRWQTVKVTPTEPVYGWVDPPRFEQVINNLVENALKYSPRQTPVTVDIWREGAEVRLSVRDEGIGIPAEDQPLVFERFHRAGNVDDRRFAGMGLGLYIARGIVEQHGGRIWVDSMPGVGSTFHVAVPVPSSSAEQPITRGGEGDVQEADSGG